MYNDWFFNFAPGAFQATRQEEAKAVEESIRATDFLRHITPELLKEMPGVLPTLRMCTCPPLAVDRLVGLAGVTKNLVACMEEGRLPARTPRSLNGQLTAISSTIERLLDNDILPWLAKGENPSESEVALAVGIVADRLCSSIANPIVKNAQEARQLAKLKQWLEARNYREISVADRGDWRNMPPGTFAFRLNVQVRQVATADGDEEVIGDEVNIPVDAVVMPMNAKPGDMPLLIEAKSAGDFTNTNKRRKEEAVKLKQLRLTYGQNVRFVLFLCGYFGHKYLSYSAAEGLDWVWEHRMNDLTLMGL